MAYSVMAVIVSDGFTPGLAGTVEPSQTRKFRYPNRRLLPSTTPFEASRPTTAPPRMCAVVGRDATTGVVDRHSRLFGYQNFLVCDGSTVPANPGVNPSLTITAMSEYAMSQVAARQAAA